MSYCCCTPQIYCRYCQKEGKPFTDVKPFFKSSDKDFEKFKHKQRKPMTDEQIKAIHFEWMTTTCGADTLLGFARAIEAAHGIKD